MLVLLLVGCAPVTTGRPFATFTPTPTPTATRTEDYVVAHPDPAPAAPSSPEATEDDAYGISATWRLLFGARVR